MTCGPFPSFQPRPLTIQLMSGKLTELQKWATFIQYLLNNVQASASSAQSLNEDDLLHESIHSRNSLILNHSASFENFFVWHVLDNT